MTMNSRNEEEQGSLAPPDPPEPTKTWRGTVVIVLVVVVFSMAFALLLFRWKQLQTFSTPLRYEGYHRFSGVLVEPEAVFGSELPKIRVRKDDGRIIVLPVLPHVEGGPDLASLPPGICVEGYVRHRKGYVEEVMIRVGSLEYFLDSDGQWTINPIDENGG